VLSQRFLVCVLNLIHDHAVVVEVDRVIAGLVRVPCLDRPQVRGAAGDHIVTGVDKDLAEQVQRLLGAIGQQDVARHSRDAILVHRGSQVLLERPISLGGTVLQG